MDAAMRHDLARFMETLGLAEEPLGLWYAETPPPDALSPEPGILPTREREERGDIDWPGQFANFSCALGHIWRARRKGLAACFSAERYGCPGASFWLGFNKPQTETIIHYVGTGIPKRLPGECYGASPDAVRSAFAQVDPRPAPARHCVVQHLGSMPDGQEPELVLFFTRPEPLCGLHQMAFFVTGDPGVVASPWSAACGSLAAWPLHYLARGENRAVVGGWDPSARKFFKTDELSFTVPYPMFAAMLAQQDASFLHRKAWPTVRKKALRSGKVWGEISTD